VPTPVEGETSKTESGQHWRQKARRADIEVHRVVVEQHHRTAGLRLGPVKGTVQQQGIGRDRDQFRSHLTLPLEANVFEFGLGRSGRSIWKIF
jgi:hypothetical protein